MLALGAALAAGSHLVLRERLPQLAREFVGRRAAGAPAAGGGAPADPFGYLSRGNQAALPLVSLGAAPNTSLPAPDISPQESAAASLAVRGRKIRIYSLPVPHEERAAAALVRLLGAEPVVANAPTAGEMAEMISDAKMSVDGQTAFAEELYQNRLPLFCAGSRCLSRNRFLQLAGPKLSPARLAERPDRYVVIYAPEGSQAAQDLAARFETEGIYPELRSFSDPDHAARFTMLSWIYEMSWTSSLAVDVNGQLLSPVSVEKTKEEYLKKKKPDRRYVRGEIVVE